MGEVLGDQAGRPEVAALDDVEHLDDVGMVEAAEEVELPLDFGGLDGEEHLNCYFFLVLLVPALEDVGVPPPSYFVGDCVLLCLSE